MRGVISVVSETFIIVTMDEFVEEWNEADLLLTKVADDVTQKRMQESIQELKKYLSKEGSRAEKMIQVAFYNAPPTVYILFANIHTLCSIWMKKQRKRFHFAIPI